MDKTCMNYPIGSSGTFPQAFQVFEISPVNFWHRQLTATSSSLLNGQAPPPDGPHQLTPEQLQNQQNLWLL